MVRAAILAFEPEPEALSVVEDELQRRYSADYEIVATDVPADALAAVERLAAEGSELALLLAGRWSDGSHGGEVLAAVHRLHPRARRALLVPWGAWGDAAASEAILGAIGRGEAEFYLLRPHGPGDEQFHAIVAEAIYDWSRVAPGGPTEARVIGAASAPRSAELRDLLTRNRIHHEFLDSDSERGLEALAELSAGEAELPLIQLLDGALLADPSDADFARAFGLATEPVKAVYDVVVVGAGPAGLSAAVYGASEGLRTLLVESRSVGGQAGSSSLIRNYMGFPRGISGAELAAEAYQQAWALGAESVFMSGVSSLHPGRSMHKLEFAGGAEVEATAVIAATGAAYRRLAVPELEAFLNAGLFYGAAMAEAQALQDQPIAVVGGANSAGQAALHLARFASEVILIVRARSLEKGMSRYLIREIESSSSVRVLLGSAVVGAAGSTRLERITVEEADGGREELPVAGVFVLIGAEPRSEWLPEEVARDRRGFVLTGHMAGGQDGERGGWPLERPPEALETTVPRLFAAGDVRAGSVKRVASAVGEGSVAMQQLHSALSEELIEGGG